jgi:putative ABC transport system permease protein
VSVLHRKLLRELRDAAGMLSMIVCILAVGICCYVSMSSAHRNLTDAKRRYYAQARMADFSIELKKAPLSELAALGALPGVGEIRPRVQFYATVDLARAVRPLNGLVLSLPDRRQPIINDIVLRTGSYFTDRRQNEVIVNEAFARHHGIVPGQWIHLLLNNRRQELFVVGTAISCEFIYLVGPGTFTPDPEHFGVFYLKRTFAEEVFDFDGAANQVLGRLSVDTQATAEMHAGTKTPPPTREALRRAEMMLEDYGVLGTTPLADQPSNRYVSGEIEQLATFSVILPVIFLAVVVLVLNVLLTRLVENQRTVTGTLKAMGYSDARLFLHFLQIGLVVGLGGGLLGCGLGYWLSYYMVALYRTFYELPELHNEFYPGIHLTGIAIGVVCSAIGCLRGSRAVLRLQPAEAMRAKPPLQGKAILLERIGWLWRRLSSGWRMVLRDLVRTKTRTLAGIFAASMGAAVLVNTFMMAEAVRLLIDFQFRWILRSDFDIAFKDERGREALDEAARLPGVDFAEPLLEVPGTFRNGNHTKKGGITGLARDARLTVPRDSDARRIRVPNEGLAMSRTLADMLRLRRGDEVSFQPTKGLRRTFRVPVREISDSYLGTAVYADIDYLSRLVDEEFALSSVQLSTDGDPRHTEALYRELKRLPALQAVNSRADMIRNLEDTVIRSLWVSLGLLIMFAGLVFFGSILNSSLVSLAERQREIATLRVLGYGPWQVGNLLLRESLIVTLLGTLLGMPLGYLLSYYSATSYNTEMFRIPITHSWLTWTGALALALIFTLAAHAVVQRSIHRMNWLEALQAKE